MFFCVVVKNTNPASSIDGRGAVRIKFLKGVGALSRMGKIGWAKSAPDAGAIAGPVRQ